MDSPRLIADRYSVRSVLGRGGMGEVYLAHDQRLDTDVALKRVPLELALEENIRNALVREARILARLSDTHIVRLFDLADTPDGMFLVLEYVCGPSMDKVLLQRKTLSIDELLRVMDHINQALTRAHALGIVHRDLKPANLLIALSGEQQKHYLHSGVLPASLLQADVKVADFGLAKMVEQSRVEASGVISGTPAYMAPEQFRGELPGPETDIYSLGFVVYRCLAGAVPMDGAQPIYFHLNKTPPPIAGIPDHMNAAIQKAICKERRDRYSSVAEFAEALRRPAIVVPDHKLKVQLAPLAPPKTIFSAWVIALIAFAVIVPMLWVVAHNASTGRSRRASDVAAISDRSVDDSILPPLAPLNPAPRIDVPPPVIESARPNAAANLLPRGLGAPQILGHFRVTGRKVYGFGSDGAMYITSDGSDIGAVRNGQLMWQYKLASDAAYFYMAPDGLIWILSVEGPERLFCFNAVGQGGELVSTAVKQKYSPAASNFHPSYEQPFRCLDPGDKQSEPAIEKIGAKNRSSWKVELDQRCSGDPLVGPDGKVIVQTQSRNVYLLSADGKVLWTYAASCQLNGPKLLTGGTLVAGCDKGVIGIAEGKQKFFLKGKSDLSEPLAQDRDGNFYRFADSNVYDRTTLIKTDSNGRDLWGRELKVSIKPDLALTPDGKVYLLNMSPGGNYALLLGEKQSTR